MPVETDQASNSSEPTAREKENSDAKQRLAVQCAENRAKAAAAAPKRLDEAISSLQILRRTPEQIAYDHAREQRIAEEDAKREIAARRQHWKFILSKVGQRYSSGLDGFRLYGSESDQQLQASVVQAIADYGESLKERIASGVNVVLFGPPGTGKDHLMVHLLRIACEIGCRPRWINALDLYGDVRDRMDSESSESQLIQEFAAPQVLAISDPLPPWGPLTPFQAQVMFRIIDRRYRAGLPTWATINVANGKEASERLGASVVDRLRDGALTLHCDWPSFRSWEAR